MDYFVRCVNFQQGRPCEHVPRILHVGHERVDSRYSRSTGHISPFRHQVFQFTLAGAGILRRDGHEHVLPAGTGFLVNMAEDGISYGCPAETNEAWEFIYLGFTGGGSAAMVEEIHSRCGPVVTLPITNSIIQSVMRLVTTHAHSETVLSRTFATGALVCELLDQISLHHEQGGADEADLVSRAMALIQRRIGDPYNATLLAAELGYSREHLSRVFKQELDTTPLAMINQMKMNEAAHLLRSTAWTNQHIAEALGFTHAQHLVRRFKAHLGLTPQAYRQSLHQRSD